MNQDRDLTIEHLVLILTATCAESESYETCRRIAEIIYDEVIAGRAA